ncbi:2af7a199-4405-43fb-abde-30e69e36a884 [Thermothielavioides terrestris]|uniref:MalT-like TPR region domain-containing protein n=2 Tax=Thermothielavioides terrestris TaxID=2587410 RepID=G2RFE7_THETT|nr:uncharacterized protein THITE_2121873 [Thermothielavioides terrestris NRRL 8126]AEO70430.1 hypothetical protein THITE_2121873 [Thermothielavioides terrestris NRRL 8126]SPQ18253.1 2af7a199-4405-43fb-abde-30e69e36a884 [Thermothielavioides terrestris]
MAQSSEAVRYSQGNKNIGAARDFPWEHAVPQNRFWDDLPFTVGRNFLSLFGADEQPPPSFDDAQSGALSKTEKLQLLLKILRERLATKEADAAPQTFYDVDYEAWNKTWLAIAGIQHELGDAAEEETLRMLIERRKDPSNLSHLHSLCGVLLNQGRYREAETSEVAVREWLDGKLGRESPQALAARRMIAQAVWMQGRRAEAEQLMEEVGRIIERTADDSPYAVYRDQQREMTDELWEKLRKEDDG